MSNSYLLTGEPRIGKTTTIKTVIDRVGLEHCGGFYTEEVQMQGRRVGFRLVTLDGQSGMFAHVATASPLRVGRYGVNLNCLESIGVAAIERAMASKPLTVIDEIGPMELHSEQFQKIIVSAIKSPHLVLGTIALKSLPWLDTMNLRESVRVYTLTGSNRDMLIERLAHFLQY
jgi:nucleoside-triphosphatase